ncbi:hypothetical protein [Sphingopyxis sp. H115]|jgi:hypothetical protein|uniref:hypothetical protein n=1 Tax=Sphingopyxis sp. H115 TaxID=1759073 RepID=UPI00073664CF|nr:hypothetical protein [Sphingopyxis sp. H115]KTE01914.1 hypothetical protein ATE71_20445 [Sphingopyxis sp. H115]MDZ4369282.1 hypothetical protein [Afipia sp.]
MSDGPYRSLNLPSHWKKVAKYAENDAFSEQQICEAVVPALARDWRQGELAQIAAAIADIADQTQPGLFEQLDRLEALAQATAGNGFRQILVHCAMQHVDAGASGDAVVEGAAADALAIWASRHTRPIEEHYQREWDATRAGNVRARIEGGFAATRYDGLARQLLGKDAPAGQRAPRKQDGLGEGPPL